MSANSSEEGIESGDSDRVLETPDSSTLSDQPKAADKLLTGGSGSNQSTAGIQPLTGDTGSDPPEETRKSETKSTKLGERCEIKALEERCDDNGEVEIIERGTYEPGSKLPYGEFALVVKQSFHKNGILRTATVQINSPQILLILQEVVGAYPTQPAGFEVPITEEAPYALFYHHWDELARYQPKDDVYNMHHSLLMKFIDVELAPAFAESSQLIKKGFITYSLLWTIFKPGTLLYESNQGHPRLYKLVTTTYKEDALAGSWFEVDCTFTDHDGTKTGKAKAKKKLSEKTMFTGRSPLEIKSLPIFPRKCIDDDGLEARLISRGKRLLALNGVQVMQYEGLLEYLKLPPHSWWGPVCERDGIWTPITVSQVSPTMPLKLLTLVYPTGCWPRDY